MTRAAAAAEIGNLINHILALAPDAGLYVSIRVEPSHQPGTDLPEADGGEGSGFIVHQGRASK
jgi:hypothetical protein